MATANVRPAKVVLTQRTFGNICVCTQLHSAQYMRNVLGGYLVYLLECGMSPGFKLSLLQCVH